MAYTKEQRDAKKIIDNQNNDTMTKTDDNVKTAPAPVNHNVEYGEYKLTVETAMKKKRDGGEELNFHLCEVGKKVKSVWIEPKRAEILNRAFEIRKLIYIKVGQPVPDKIKRIAAEDEDGNAIWKDEYIMPA